MRLRLAWLAAAAALTFSAAAPAQIRTAKDPAVKKYLKDYGREEKEQKKEERKARREDPHRFLRPYFSLEEIYAAMDKAREDFPDLVRVIDYGQSVEGRPLRMIEISKGPGDKAKVLYSANIHGNEMAGNMICLALMDYFLEESQKDRDVEYLLQRLNVYIIPVLNPDGMARTVRQQSGVGTLYSITRKNANGVDLNRNYPYPAEALDRLRDSAGSSHKWSVNYRGPGPLSEPESRAIDALFAEHKFTLHCNWHTTGGLVMSPPATLPEPLPDDELHDALRKAYRDAMFDKYKQHTELQFYPTIGSLDDYLYHRYGALCITMEVGKKPVRRALLGCHNGTCSPLFWASNVYCLEREIANNLPGAIELAWRALAIHEDPAARKWTPPESVWVGEPN